MNVKALIGCLALLVTSWLLLDTQRPAEAEASAPRLVLSIGQTSRINAVAYSSDNRLLATGGDDGSTTVRTVSGGAEIRRFSVSGAVHYVAFGPHDVLFSGDDSGATLWNVATGAQLKHFPGRYQASDSGFDGAYAFSSRGHYAITVAEGGIASLWDVASGTVLRRMNFGKDDPSAAAFSPDELSIAVSFQSGIISTYRISSGALVWSKRASDFGPPSIAFSGNGRTIIVGSTSPNVRNASDGALIRQLNSDKLLVLSVALSADGSYALAGSWSKAAWLWDVKSGRQLLRVEHPEAVSAVSFANDDRTFVTGAWDRGVRFWDRRSGLQLHGFGSPANGIREVGFRKGEPYIVIASDANTAFLWLPLAGTFRSFLGHKAEISSASLSPDGKSLLTGSADNTASLWDADAGNEIFRFAPHSNYVMDPQFSNDATTITTAGGKAYVWDGFNGHLERKVGGDDITSGVFREALSSDGSCLVTTSVPLGGQRNVDFWNPRDGTKQHSVRTDMRAWAFKPGSHVLAIATEDGDLNLIDADRGFASKTILHRDRQIAAVAFSSSGSLMAAGDSNGIVRLWKTSNFKSRFFNAGVSVSHLSVSEDQRTMLIGDSTSDLVAAWDISEQPRKIADLASFSDGTWVVVDGKGRFDTNNLDRISSLAWVLPKAPTTALPLEDFMRQFYRPNLLKALLARTALPPVSSLSSLDLRQAAIRITSIQRDPRTKGVFVHLSIGVSPTIHASDLRLFRDGTLVAHIAKVSRNALILGPIALPHRSSPSRVVFKAYAFNDSKVKSENVSFNFALPPTKAVPKPRLYLVAIGVSKNEHSVWNLNFADADAKATEEEFRRLFSSRTDRSLNTVLLTSSDATEKNLRAVLDVLAGRPVPSATVAAIRGLSAFSKASPDDSLLLFYSGHGYSSSSGEFYIVPYDTGTASFSKTIPQRLLSASVLANWLEKIDAGSMTLVVDSCESAEAVQAGDFRPGPLGNSGLGQIAYDKGMRILAASEADSVAIESNTLQHGVLSYALLNEGLAQLQADRSPRDGSITFSKWLRYGVYRVPDIDMQLPQGSIESPPGGSKELQVVATIGPQVKVAVQQPILFDFARGSADIALVGDRYSHNDVEPEIGIDHSVKDEIIAFRAAVGKTDASERARAMRAFLSQFPESEGRGPAEGTLVAALLEAKSPPSDILAAGLDFSAAFRGQSASDIKVRISLLSRIAQYLLDANFDLDAALAFAYEAHLTCNNFDIVDPQADALYSQLLKSVALIGHKMSVPLDAEMQKSLDSARELRSGVRVVLYGAVNDVSGSAMRREFRSLHAEPGKSDSVRWVEVSPDDSSVQLLIGKRVGIFATPAILVLDGAGVVRFKNSRFMPDLANIVRLQLAEIGAPQ